MEKELILYPMYLMVLLTAYISIRLGQERVKAIQQDGLTPGYFYYNKGGKPPRYLLRTEQHYVNLFELPVLFYAAILTAYTADAVDWISLSLAWLFVVSRYLHAYIHVQLNKLMPRRRIFMLGAVILIGLWLYLFLNTLFVNSV
jgi:hypothetical protein